MASGSSRFARGFEITDEALAFDTIATVGPGGCFTDSDHTLRHFRDEHWQPRLWSRDMRRAWQDAGGRTDADRARDQCYELVNRPDLPPRHEDETEGAFLGVIDRAQAGLRA